jgi:LCP family protein required for cell wall assembly
MCSDQVSDVKWNKQFSAIYMEQAMKKNDPGILTFVVTILILLIASACTTQTQFQQPLAPTMDIPTSTVASEISLPTSALPDSNNAIPGVEIDLPTSAPTLEVTVPTNTPEAKKNCGESGSKIILFVGSDVLGSSKPNGADAIRLIKVNFDTQTVKIITFPRDLLIQTGSVNNATKIQHPLGLSYFTAFEAAAGSSLEKNAVGAGVVAQILSNNFGVQPANYVTVQMDKFAAMIDTVGGVEVTLPAAITTEHNVSFPAGKQTLNGAMATEYVRSLNPGGESARTARQNEVVSALQAKMVNVNTLPQIPILITQFKDAFITDLSTEQLTNLACLALTMPKANVTFGAITSPDLMINNVPNVEKIKTYLNTILGN